MLVFKVNFKRTVFWENKKYQSFICDLTNITVKDLLDLSKSVSSDNSNLENEYSNNDIANKCFRYNFYLALASKVSNLPYGFFMSLSGVDFLAVINTVSFMLGSLGLVGKVSMLRTFSVRLGMLYSTNPFDFENKPISDFVDILNETAEENRKEQERLKKLQNSSYKGLR